MEATGTDSAAAAIAHAQAKARQRGLTARFLVSNALQLASLGEPFETVLDCALFHVLDDADRCSFVDHLKVAIPPGGRYFMPCFSEHQPGDAGPRRITQAEIPASFSSGWQVDSITPTELEITMSADGIPGWLACITRT